MVCIRTMPTTKPRRVPPYCQGEIPTILPLLSTQVEILYRPVSRIPVSAEEELAPPTCQTPTNPMGCVTPKATPPAPPQRIFIPPRASTLPPRAVTPPVLQPHAQTPNPSSSKGKSVAKGKAKTVNFSEDKGEDEEEEYSSLSEIEEIEEKIPKPRGEIGRPGRGGYNLEKQLNWDGVVLERFKVNIAYLHGWSEMKRCI